jgi:putative flippase GtrA
MRFVRFNGVGAIGFAVQLGVLGGLLHAGLSYLPATAAAVELSILNNFVWHERWTWRDRPAAGLARLARFGRFHLLNGLVSLGGNLLIVSALTGDFGVNPILSNVVAVIACGILNYFGADQIVFSNQSRLSQPGPANSSHRRITTYNTSGRYRTSPSQSATDAAWTRGS